MGHGGNVIEELTADHREVEAMFDSFNQLPVGSEQRREIADQFTIELVRHSVAEETHLYPAVREHIADGDSLADKELADHAEVEKHLKKLEGLNADHVEFDGLVTTIASEVTDHVRDEEDRLFPMLADACTPEQLNELGDKIRDAKKTAPTRPHPSAPSTPPLKTLLAPGMGLVDRARDYVTGRGR
jgi:hemerythrin superfamily protein